MTKGWKKTLAGFAAMAAMAGSAQVGLAATCGDVDNNGSFQVGDCVNMFDIIAGPPDVLASPCGSTALQCGDLNGDGIISVGDAIVCINNISAATTPVCATPPAATCPALVNSAITQTTHWGPSGCTITLDGTIFVNSNVLVKIDPGVTIKGKASPTTDPVSALVFRRDSRIDAQGTVSDPIIFTSDEPANAKTVGAWGGLVLNGRGTVNVPGGEGLAEGLTGVPFGGNAPNENSGTLTFARIEFAGHVLSLDNELNSLTMNALGRGTTIHHVEALRGKDDGFEWFGGNNFIHHVISAANNDDNLDTQLGTQGGAQYALVIQHKASTDANPHSNGFEADNNENGFDLLPRSNAKFCNITLMGYRQQTTGTGAVAASGGLLRRGTGEQVANSIIMDWATAAFKIDDNATLTAACSGGVLTGVLNVRNSIIFGNAATAAGSAVGGGCTSASAVGLFGLTSADPQIDINARLFNPPFTAVPLAGSPAGTLATLDCSTIDAIFDNNTVAPYIGAFAPGGVDWATGAWVSYDLDG
jgi:hypothetical protein